MLKTRIILVAVSAIVVGALFFLPKVVVENDSQMEQVDGSEATESDPHAAVPEVLATSIKSLRTQYLEAAGNEKSAIFADSLAELYTEAGQFDSAAWFADKSASFFNNLESYISAGNSYYDAYTFALNPEKQAEMAEKTRFYLGKVMEMQPQNLEAKIKISMTYLSSNNPMQGILMLREVLEVDPKNELALFNMGMLSLQSGQNERAIERLQELVAINPNYTQAQLLLGVAYMNVGNKAKAREQFETVKEMDNDPAVQASVDSYLRELK